ncbi:UNVERIFIED_CONTAM: hypothetical protein RMT77_001901 [Armadillidium vulgare]
MAFILLNLMLLFLSFGGQYTVGEKKNDLLSSCNQSECLRCDLESTECVKCLHVMMLPARTCKRNCPHGYDPIWAEHSDVFGRICQERSVLAMVSHRDLGIIAGVSVLGAVAVGVFLGVFLLRKRVKMPPPDSPPRGLPKLLQDKRPKTVEVVIKGKERAEFLGRLRQLRSESPYILRMVTSTRKRFRSRTSLGHEAPSDAKTKACKAVVRDLSRVLCLLSIKEEYIHTAPKDWRSLLSWTERLLARYKRQEEQKERGEDGYQSAFKGGQGHVRLNKSLFITRQEQLKADKDKRLKESDKSISDDSHQQYNGKPPSFYSEESHIDCEEFFSSDLKIPNTTNKENNSCSKKTKSEKMRKFFNINKILWSKMSSLRPSKESDLEKGGLDIIKSTNDDNSLSFEDDDIPSQTFFDHIEAFAFDLENDLQDCNGNSDLFSEDSPTQDKYSENDFVSRNNIKNRNNRNGRIMSETFISDNRNHLYRKKHSFDKPNKVSRLKRISSSILSKDRKLSTLRQEYSKPRKRRPLKRQKRVEKEAHSKIIEKYKKNKHQSTENSENTENSAIESCQQYETPQSTNGEDYVNIIETPISTPLPTHSTQRTLSTSRKPPSHFNSEVNQNIFAKPVPAQHFSQSDIKIIHSSYSDICSTQNKWESRSDNNNKYYTRCEIMTNV